MAGQFPAQHTQTSNCLAYQVPGVYVATDDVLWIILSLSLFIPGRNEYLVNMLYVLVLILPTTVSKNVAESFNSFFSAPESEYLLILIVRVRKNGLDP